MRYSQICSTVAMSPVWYIVTGSRALSGVSAVTVTMPPGLGALEAAGEAVSSVDEPPQAASSDPAALMENPKIEARTSSWRRVMRRARTSSTRC